MTERKSWMALDEWQRLVEGIDCPNCQVAASTADDESSLYVGRLPLSAVRFSRNQRAPGYTVVYCRRHVSEPFELTPRYAHGFFDDVMAVAEALQRVYRPLKLNYQILGNVIPHLHCHIVPRYRGDLAPHAPPHAIFTAPALELTSEEYAAAVQRLREEMRDRLRS